MFWVLIVFVDLSLGDLWDLFVVRCFFVFFCFMVGFSFVLWCVLVLG